MDISLIERPVVLHVCRVIASNARFPNSSGRNNKSAIWKRNVSDQLSGQYPSKEHQLSMILCLQRYSFLTEYMSVIKGRIQKRYGDRHDVRSYKNLAKSRMSFLMGTCTSGRYDRSSKIISRILLVRFRKNWDLLRVVLVVLLVSTDERRPSRIWLYKIIPFQRSRNVTLHSNVRCRCATELPAYVVVQWLIIFFFV